MFDLKGDPRDLTGEASEVLAMTSRGEGRMAIVQKLAEIQSKFAGTVVSAKCEKLADELIRYVPYA